MSNGHIVEGIVATFGGIFIFISLREFLGQTGLLADYYCVGMILGFVLLWYRDGITSKIVGVIR